MAQQLAIPDQTTHVPLHHSPYSNEKHRWPVLSSALQSTTHQSFLLFGGFQPDSLGANKQTYSTFTANCCATVKQFLISLTTPHRQKTLFTMWFLPQHSVIEYKVRGPNEVDPQSAGCKEHRPHKISPHFKSFLLGTLLSLGNSRPCQCARNICWAQKWKRLIAHGKRRKKKPCKSTFYMLKIVEIYSRSS